MEFISWENKSSFFTRTTNWANTKTEFVVTIRKHQMAHVPIAQTIAKGLREAGEAK